MLILDTNVVSELMRPEPDMAVWVWMSRQVPASLHTTSITFAEILYGLTLLPESRRRQGLLVAVGRIFAEQFQGRILSFDENAAPDYAALMAERRRLGRPIALLDAQIAAIARRQKAMVATRNVKDFEDCGIGVVNPWEL
ncbi:MAG: type II toxin-antitoxin system VapC family toxin [Ferrovibrio sp.]